jgi:sugar lactone lactonase YvrE
MYLVDSRRQQIDIFDFCIDDGSLLNRRCLAKIPPDEGLPDGLTVDANGGIWVALFGAGRLRRYTPAGIVEREIELPVTLVTSMAFGGADLGDLYITTASHRLTPDEAKTQVHAGSVFVCRPGVAGQPANRFRWL